MRPCQPPSANEFIRLTSKQRPRHANKGLLAACASGPIRTLITIDTKPPWALWTQLRQILVLRLTDRQGKKKRLEEESRTVLEAKVEKHRNLKAMLLPRQKNVQSCDLTTAKPHDSTFTAEQLCCNLCTTTGWNPVMSSLVLSENSKSLKILTYKV